MAPSRAGEASQRSVLLRFVAATFLWQTAFQSTYFVGIIGCATYELGATGLVVSMLTLTMNVALVVATMAAGVLVDRIGPCRTILAALVVMSVCGLAAWLAPVSLALLAVVSAVEAFTAGVVFTSADAFPRFVTADKARLAKANSLAATAISLAIIVGPALSGAIARALPTQCVFSLLFLAPLPAFALVWRLRGVDEGSRREEAAAPDGGEEALAGVAREAGGGVALGEGRGHRRGALSELAEGVRFALASRDLRRVLVVSFLGFFAYGAFDSLESLFYRDVLHASVDWMGWLNAIMGVGSLVGAAVLARVPAERFTVRLISLLLLVTGSGSMLYVGTSSLAATAVGQFFVGAGFGAMGPVRSTLVQDLAGEEYVGRVTAVMRVALNSAGTVPLLVAPFLADALGVQQVLFVAATFVAVLGACYTASSGRRGR